MSYTKLKSYIESRGFQHSNEVWAELIASSEIVSYKKNEILIARGNRNKYAYFVTSGGFKTSIISEEGNLKTVWFNLDCQFPVVATLDSHFTNEQTKYEVIALEDSKVIRHSRKVSESIAQKHPRFNQIYFSNVIADIIEMNELRTTLQSNTPSNFLEYLNYNYPELVKRVPSKDLAQFIGVTPEWYSKMKRRIK